MSNFIRTICSLLLSEYEDLATELIGYFEFMPPDTNIRTMLFYVHALSATVSGITSYDSDRKRAVYNSFVTILSEYVLNIYDPQLLNPADIVVLPELHRFGYYMALAISAINDGQQLEYVRALRKALTCCKDMKPVVEYYIENIEL